MMFNVLTVLIIVVIVGLLIDIVRKMSGSGIILFIGLATLFIGERVLGLGEWRIYASGFGAALVAASMGLRAYAMTRSQGDRKKLHRQALAWTLVVLAGLVLYAITSETGQGLFGVDEDSAPRWIGAWSSIFPIVVLAGAFPIFVSDRALAVHPVVLPPGAGRRAIETGLIAALSIALIFPVNYIASSNDMEWDYAYFRTTKPGESTLSIVKTLAEPVEVVLFFSPGNDVRREVEPYFNQLQQASEGNLTVRVVDQALDPELAEELKIRDNGQVAIRQGDNHEPIKIGTDLDKAKRDLKKLDSNVQKAMLKLTKGQRTVYMLVGHGEASSREKENRLRKLNLFKKNALESQNLKVKNLGVADGSTDAIPDDAAAVIIAAPETEILPEEAEALKAYWDDGGKLFVLLEPDGDALTALLSHIGVEAGPGPLAHETAFINQRRGPADRVLLATNKFGSHASVKTLSRQSAQMGVIVPTVRPVAKLEGTANKVSTLIRSFPDTWADADGNFKNDEGEEKKVFELAVAVEPAEGDARAIVVGDVELLGDPILSQSKGNFVFGLDGIRWLIGDEDIAGDIESEEDVKIVHSRDEDQMWFYATVFAVPFLILAIGLLIVRRRITNVEAK
jgi:hypothetical protein